MFTTIPEDFGKGGAHLSEGSVKLRDLLVEHTAGLTDHESRIASVEGGNTSENIAIAAAQTTANGAVTVNTAQAAAIALKAPILAPVFTSSVKVTTGLSSWNVAPPGAQPAVGASLTNNVAPTGSANVLPDFTDGSTYSTDYPALHATISQMAAKIVALELSLKGDGTVGT